jgi:hypothetical protein
MGDGAASNWRTWVCRCGSNTSRASERPRGGPTCRVPYGGRVGRDVYSTQRVLAGQPIAGGPTLGGIRGEYDSNVQALFHQTGRWPAISGMQHEGADATVGPLQVSSVNAQAVSWAAAGGVMLIQYQPFDPGTMGAPDRGARAATAVGARRISVEGARHRRVGAEPRRTPPH